MRFSVIVPCYNSKNTISNALNSIKCQTYVDFEVIIVDDGSTDETADVCKGFARKDDRFKYIYQENKGVSAARNLGIEYAKGDFLVFLDSDDIYSREYLSTFDALIKSYHDFNNFWAEYLEVKSTDHGINCESKYESSYFSTLDRSDISPLPALWNKAFRTSIVREHNIKMRENLSLGEDFIFNYEYLDAAGTRIAHSDAQIYYYTKSNNDSLDSKYRNNLLEIFQTIESVMYKYLIKWKFDEKKLQQYYEYVFYNRIKVLYNTYRPECTLTKREKIKYNNSILHSKDFNNAFKKINCYINPFYKIAYKIGSWRLISLLDKLVIIKKHIKRQTL